MRWPWQRNPSSDLLVLSWSGQTLAYVRAVERAQGQYEVTGFGVERQGSHNIDDFVRRLDALGLKGCQTRVMLRPSQYQWLQIEAPGVPPEELRSAARYRIRDMLDLHIDDVTLDVMRVGDDRVKAIQHLFVVAAPQLVLRGATDLGQLMRWKMPVVDVQETAQRNLQNALAASEGRPDRANAALVLVDEAQAMLTICANEELFYTRRLEIPPDFLRGPWGAEDAVAAPLVDSYAPLGEYVPDYGVGGVSYGSDYSAAPVASSGTGGVAGSAESERAQRFLVEVQRSLDLWDRAWSSMPLAVVRVFAGARTAELAGWLSRELGQPVVAMDVGAYFTGFSGASEPDRTLCWPLLGTLMRSENRKL